MKLSHSVPKTDLRSPASETSEQWFAQRKFMRGAALAGAGLLHAGAFAQTRKDELKGRHDDSTKILSQKTRIC